jgi:hypothetical protein
LSHGFGELSQFLDCLHWMDLNGLRFPATDLIDFEMMRLFLHPYRPSSNQLACTFTCYYDDYDTMLNCLIIASAMLNFNFSFQFFLLTTYVPLFRAFYLSRRYHFHYYRLSQKSLFYFLFLQQKIHFIIILLEKLEILLRSKNTNILVIFSLNFCIQFFFSTLI